MAYRLRPGNPLDEELSRIVAKEFAAAREELEGNPSGSREEAVHEARKSIKKIRAVLRLLQADLGEDYRIENERLRNIAHQLSPVRDADARVEVVKSVRDRYRDLVTPSIFASVQRGFLRQKQVIITRLHLGRLLRRVADELGQSAHSTVEQVRRVAGAATMRAGVLRGYRRARKTMAEVRVQPEDVLFHAWRRRVKDHEYHLRLLEGFSPRAHARAQRLSRLETWLGDDHNLVVMRAAILDAPARFGDARATTVVLGCAVKYQATLRRRALGEGDRPFAAKPRTFRQTINAWLRNA